MLLSIYAFMAFFQLAQAAINIYNLTAPIPGLSDTCIGVLNQAVNCDESLATAGKGGRFESDATLSTLCVASCTTALSTYMRRISQSCGTARLPVRDGYSYSANYGAQLYLERYNSVCFKNS